MIVAALLSLSILRIREAQEGNNIMVSKAMGTSASAWTPLITGIDLPTIGKQAFDEKMAEFAKKRAELAAEGKLPPMPFDHDGWYDVTPQMAETALLRSAGNRQIVLATTRAFANDMANNGWKATGEPLCFSEEALQEGHHRGWAGYLSGLTFKSYVVVSVPAEKNLFSYYNCGKGRTVADALFIGGWNGAGRTMAQAVADLALRYDHDALGIDKQGRFPKVTARHALDYMEAHPDFAAAARRMMGNYADAVDVIISKPAAVFFAWLVIRAYGEELLDEFCTALGTGAMLDEDSPILAARNRLLRPEPKGGPKIASRTRLAFVNKAFLMFVAKQKMPRVRGKIAALSIDLDDPFPRIDAPLAEAAE